MSKTLLNGVNEIFKRCGVISGDANALTTLTDSARQRPIDVAVQVINEGIEELYSSTGNPLASAQGESSIALSAGARAYTLASGLLRLRFPLIDKTNSQIIVQYPGGYAALLQLDLEQNDTGLPYYAAIRETDGLLHLDRSPTSAEAGRTYTYQYDKDVSLSSASDTVPFADAVFRAMVPAWVQLYKRDMRNEFDAPLYAGNVGRAARYLTKAPPRTSYSPRR